MMRDREIFRTEKCTFNYTFVPENIFAVYMIIV